ncbi:NYN domain-containing protein [candidate division WOR-3 bacterium]|nr:NYN domain-containing protein [candidate division WOR-3 bacterium]MCK4526688.1 NYN domain-containing protein [candidate division WOR-3 bacterium]
MKKVAVFIDVQNIQQIFEKQGAEIRYDRLKEYLIERYRKENAEVIKFSAFIPFKLADENRAKLIDAISLIGYRVLSKQAKDRPDGSIKANMDVEMALEVVSISDFVDEIVMITGDSDFEPLIDFLSRRGKHILLIGPGRGPTAIEIIRASDDFVNLDEIEGVVLI